MTAAAGPDAPTFAVIGAGHGDEGKGLLTDALCDALGRDAVVVRHNGGAQAGHTVVSPDGRRHVFHHVGSGSLAGAATVLSRHVVSNPEALGDEMADLARLGVHPRVSADARGRLTTPWDMMVNQFVEAARGDGRHGSCGLGFNETVERCGDPRFATRLDDVRRDRDALRRRFDLIRREWVPARLTRLGHPGLWLRHRDLILSEAGLERAIAAALAMSAHVDIVPRAADAVPAGSPLVFEGAQGLMLHQDRGTFPHVTRSDTGLGHAAEVAWELGRPDVAVLYATRCYATRHGAGPLAHELDGPPGPGVVDATNRPNPWQGRLRFGLLDLDRLGAAVRADLLAADAAGLRTAPRFAVTCLDQLPDRVGWVEGGVERRGTIDHLVARAGALLPGAPAPVTGRGPTRSTLTDLAGWGRAAGTEPRRSPDEHPGSSAQ